MPRWKELDKYCQKNGWILYISTDHNYYKKLMDDGTYLNTKVSRGSGEIPSRLWKDILKKQLKITQEEFNRGLK